MRSGKIYTTPRGEASGTGADTHLTDWTRLSTGGWVGFNEGWLCKFDPRDRSTETCFRIQLGDEVPSGYTDPRELNVDANGNLWAWIRVNPSDHTIPVGISLGRYDGKDRFEGPFVPLTLDTCDMLIGFD